MKKEKRTTSLRALCGSYENQRNRLTTFALKFPLDFASVSDLLVKSNLINYEKKKNKNKKKKKKTNTNSLS